MNINSKSSSSFQTDHSLLLNRVHLACTRCYHAVLRRLADVKAQVTTDFRHEMTGYEQVLSASLNEAEAVAWQTPYPHLLFPALAEEKAIEARQWAAQQRAIWNRPSAGSVERQLAA